MALLNRLFGKPIATEEGEDEQVGCFAGVPVLGLDALASAAYGPEALLTVLLPLGAAGLKYMAMLTPVTVIVLLTVYFSYRQTLPAYPNGGGAYTVTKENLGQQPSLLAAASLALDYILNVAVAVAAGVGALVSAAPTLLPYTVWLCLLVLTLLTLINLRGVRSTGLAFMAPTYLFIACMFGMIAYGVTRSALAGWQATPLAPVPAPHAATSAVSIGLVLRAFANGCTALTGVEAVSNGVPIFRKPTVINARRTLTMIVAVLVVLLIGETMLCNLYGVLATEPGKEGFQSVLSSLLGAIFGRGFFYHLSMASIVTVLLLSANTSFADFPRLCRILAGDKFLPEPFVHRGRRLAFSYGILLLSVISGTLIVLFEGITDSLIPLFAIGALGAFTMSQIGMVGHWRKSTERHARRSLVINALGAIATGVTLLIVMIAKFTEGAWVTVFVAAGIVVVLRKIRAHYARIEASTDTDLSLELGPLEPPLVVVPLRRWDAVSLKGLRLALRLSREVTVVQVLTQDRDIENLSERWDELATAPAQQNGFNAPQLVVLRSEYRELFSPLLKFIHSLADQHPRRQIAVVIPELVEPRWYHYLLHNHTPTLLRTLLINRGGPQVVVVSAPWHLEASSSEKRLLGQPPPWWRRFGRTSRVAHEEPRT
jgi:amino acid transporter